MKQEELKALQEPLKKLYATDPAAAMITLKAEGIAGEGISCRVETGKLLAEAGLHPATGGNGMQACSGDMLLEALVACAGVTLKAVSTALGLKVDHCKIHAEGDLDFRGTLAVSKEAKVGFEAIRLDFEITSQETDENIQLLIKLTERYCVVLQTIKSGVPVQPSFTRK